MLSSTMPPPVHPTGGYDEVRAYPGGAAEYLLRGVRHREDGPAYISGQGNEQFFRNGVLHQDGGLPAITTRNGATFYYLNGVRTDSTGIPA